jgi:hypothetical protein
MRWLLLLSVVTACTDRGADHTSDAKTPAIPQSSAGPIANEPAIATVATPRAVAADTAFPAPEVPVAPQDSLRFDATGHPISPWIVRNTCEGEDCGTQFDAEACAATELHAEPEETSPVVARIAEGERVEVVRNDLHVNRAGIVVMKRDHVLDEDTSDENDVYPRKDTLRFTRGDTIFVLHYLALGRWVFAYRGRTYDTNEFWGTSTHDMGANEGDSSVAIARSRPEREDWLLVATRAGVIGWWSGKQWELQSTFAMQHWNDDCAQVRKRALRS